MRLKRTEGLRRRRNARLSSGRKIGSRADAGRNGIEAIVKAGNPYGVTGKAGYGQEYEEGYQQAA